MGFNTTSIRPFLGSKDFAVSRSFYRDLGFEESVLTSNFSLFKMGNTAFYLQDAYVKDWVDNTQVFLEINNVDHFWKELITRGLAEKYEGVRIEPIRMADWGRECFIHDPCGILWHIGEFH